MRRVARTGRTRRDWPFWPARHHLHTPQPPPRHPYAAHALHTGATQSAWRVRALVCPPRISLVLRLRHTPHHTDSARNSPALQSLRARSGRQWVNTHRLHKMQYSDFILELFVVRISPNAAALWYGLCQKSKKSPAHALGRISERLSESAMSIWQLESELAR